MELSQNKDTGMILGNFVSHMSFTEGYNTVLLTSHTKMILYRYIYIQGRLGIRHSIYNKHYYNSTYSM